MTTGRINQVADYRTQGAAVASSAQSQLCFPPDDGRVAFVVTVHGPWKVMFFLGQSNWIRPPRLLHAVRTLEVEDGLRRTGQAK